MAAVVIGGPGLCGVAYTAAVGRRIRRQNAYRPQFEDWLCHFALPLVAYAGIGLSAVAVSSSTREALFGVGSGALLLLFTGIHNAWDAVTWHVLVEKPDTKPGPSNQESSAKATR